MEGSILFCSTEYALENNLDMDVKLQITHYVNKGLLSGFIHVPQLAPSESLLNKTNRYWKKLKFTEEEKILMKSGKTGTWWDLYYPKFCEEMYERKDFQTAYNRLKELLMEGKSIVCVCYCKDDQYCHRKILGDKLKNEGFSVVFK